MQKLRITPQAPAAVVLALEHVREHHPEVTHVVYLRTGRWLYLDDYGDSPAFSAEVSLSLLYDAVDSLPQLPACFAGIEEE